MRRIWSLGALGEGSGWDLRIRPAAPAPAPAAASGPKPGPKLEIWKSGTQKSGNLRSKKIQKIKILKIKIRSAQNVGKVWISRKKILLAPFGAIWANFLRGPEKCKNNCNFCLFSLVGQWVQRKKKANCDLSSRRKGILKRRPCSHLHPPPSAIKHQSRKRLGKAFPTLPQRPPFCKKGQRESIANNARVDK